MQSPRAGRRVSRESLLYKFRSTRSEPVLSIRLYSSINPFSHFTFISPAGRWTDADVWLPDLWDLRRGRRVSSESLLHVFERPRSEPVPSIRTYSSINPLSHFPIHLRVLGNVGPMLMCGSPQLFSLPRPPHSRSSVRAFRGLTVACLSVARPPRTRSSVRAFRAALCCPPTSYEELNQTT